MSASWRPPWTRAASRGDANGAPQGCQSGPGDTNFGPALDLSPKTDLFATAAKGTEDLLAAELAALGATRVRAGRGGVHFAGGMEAALRACLGSRLAMRVLAPVAEFDAAGAEALYEGAAAVRWSEYLTPSHTFAVDATVRGSKVTHSHFAALKVKDAIADALRAALGSRPSVDAKDPDVRVVLHLAADRAALSLDLAGEPLFKRGWRTKGHATPLKETLAAAVVLASGWRAEVPFVDPMCGSGTIAIEAALLAMNRAPGLARRLGVERWPGFGAGQRQSLDDLRREFAAKVRPPQARIVASDRDAQAVAAARANVRAAGVEVTVREADAREVEPTAPPGFVVFNPPYGERLGPGTKGLKTFYWQLGQRMRRLSGHTIAVLAGHPAFESAFGLRPAGRRALFNGPIECTLLTYSVP